MKEEFAFDYPVMEAETLSDYETERGKPMPNKIHSVIQSRLDRWLGIHYGDQFEIGTELSLDIPGKPATPDVVMMEKEPLDYFDDTPRESDPPLVAIEIASPSQGFSVFKDKAVRYFAFGVRSYWLVQPNLRTIYVFSAPQVYEAFFSHDVLRDPVVGVEMPLAEIFT